jgi:hypothetical protein
MELNSIKKLNDIRKKGHPAGAVPSTGFQQGLTFKFIGVKEAVQWRRKSRTEETSTL